MKYANIREEEIKNSVAADFFSQFDCTEIIGNIVCLRHKRSRAAFYMANAAPLAK